MYSTTVCLLWVAIHSDRSVFISPSNVAWYGANSVPLKTLICLPSSWICPWRPAQMQWRLLGGHSRQFACEPKCKITQPGVNLCKCSVEYLFLFSPVSHCSWLLIHLHYLMSCLVFSVMRAALASLYSLLLFGGAKRQWVWLAVLHHSYSGT